MGVNGDEDGIVYMENYNIKLISLDDFKKLKSIEQDEIQPHCYMCFNMNMNIIVTCFNCYKLYCKHHSYCILCDDDMPYCSQKCFLEA